MSRYEFDPTTHEPFTQGPADPPQRKPDIEPINSMSDGPVDIEQSKRQPVPGVVGADGVQPMSVEAT